MHQVVTSMMRRSCKISSRESTRTTLSSTSSICARNPTCSSSCRETGREIACLRRKSAEGPGECGFEGRDHGDGSCPPVRYLGFEFSLSNIFLLVESPTQAATIPMSHQRRVLKVDR